MSLRRLLEHVEAIAITRTESQESKLIESVVRPPTGGLSADDVIGSIEAPFEPRRRRCTMRFGRVRCGVHRGVLAAFVAEAGRNVQ